MLMVCILGQLQILNDFTPKLAIHPLSECALESPVLGEATILRYQFGTD